MADLVYTADNMFTRFMPETKAGEDAWRTMANQLDGVAVVLNIHAQVTINQLRKAGYKVAKAKKPAPVIVSEIDELLAELGV